MTPATSLGFECVRFADAVLGIRLMPWQRWFLIHALELHPSEVAEDGSPLFRFRKIVLLVGRQNGKSTVMQVLTLWRMYVDRCDLVIGTAQDLDIAETLWGEVVEIAQEIPSLSAEIEQVYRGTGKKELKLHSGEAYKVKAATRRGGRGLSGELVLLDELREHQSWDAWAAVTKTTNARERAQIYGISNAGDATSIVLRYLREQAHAALGNPDGLDAITEQPDDEDLVDDVARLGIFEWSAKPGCDIRDRDGWRAANPALGHRISDSTIASDASTDPEWIFRTEVLCQWSSTALDGPFPGDAWDRGRDKRPVSHPDLSRIDKAPQIGVGLDTSADRSTTYVAFAGVNQYGKTQVEVVAKRAGSGWVEQWLTERLDQWPILAIAGQTKGAPVSSLMADLAAVKVTKPDGSVVELPIMEWSGGDLSAACGRFYDMVCHDELAHLEQPPLDIAAATAATKPLGDAWVWNRTHSPTDVAPLVAATAAVHALTNHPAPTVSAYESGELIVA